MAQIQTGVYEAILAVMRDLGPFAKGLEVEDLRSQRTYNVIGLDEIEARVQPLLIQHGLLLFPVNVDHQSWDVERNGVTTHFAKVIVQYKAVATSDGSEEIFSSVGESESPNDKSTAAAFSFAQKFLFRQLFHLVTGEADPDTVGTSVVASGATQAPRPAAAPAPRPAPAPAAPPTPAAPRQTEAMATTIAATAGAGGNKQTKPMQQKIWAKSHREMNWDDQGTINWIGQELNIDLTGLTFNQVNESLTFEQGKLIIEKLKNLTGTK